MTVFVVQNDPYKNFDAAKQHGELEFLFGRDCFPDNAQVQAEKMLEIAGRKLNEFDVTKDFVLLTGDPIGIGIVFAVLSYYVSTIPVLKWDKQDKSYYPVTVAIDIDSATV